MKVCVGAATTKIQRSKEEKIPTQQRDLKLYIFSSILGFRGFVQENRKKIFGNHVFGSGGVFVFCLFGRFCSLFCVFAVLVWALEGLG